jgi:ribose-phosphate pyrophosphokinase
MKPSSPIIFATQSYRYMQDAVLRAGFGKRGKVEVQVFPDGERYQRIENNVCGRRVVLIGGTVSDSATLELYDLACAIAKYGAERLTLVIPYFGCSTMERAVKPGEVVTAKTRARLISSIPNAADGNHVVLVDLHQSGLMHYFEGDIQPAHLYAKEIVKRAFREFGGRDFVLACTDAGRAKWVESLAGEIGADVAFVYKRRRSGSDTEITGVSAAVKGRRVVIYDDMIRTGGSLLQAARAYRAAGALQVFAVTTHGVFPGDAFQRIVSSGLLDGLACTDTHPNVLGLPRQQIRVLSVARLLTDYLKANV